MPHFVVIGLGSIGRRHAANLAAEHPGARFTFVRHQGGSDDFVQRLGGRVVSDLSDLSELAADAVDLAVLATPSANHVESLPTLLDLGWPLLVEKPIVTDLADCDDIVKRLDDAPAARRAAGFNLRHLPSIERMKAVLDSGQLGRVVRASFVAGQWLPDWRPGTDYRQSYSAHVHRGGGVELDLSHEFDLARWFFGEMEVDFARCGRFSDLELDSNDTAVAVLSPTGRQQPLVTVSLDYVSRRLVRRYEVVGDRGRLDWSIDGRLDLTTEEGARSLVADEADHDVGSSYVHMLRALDQAGSAGEPAAVQSLADGLASSRLALQVRERGAQP